MTETPVESALDRAADSSRVDGETEDHRRKPWIAVLLGFLAIGLGQVYNGQWKKALVFCALSVVVFVVFVGLLVSGRFWPAMIFFLAAAPALWLVPLVDAGLVASRRGAGYRLARTNRVIVYLGLIALSIGVREAMTGYTKTNLVRAYRMPSESMTPTLKVGDFMFADMRERARHPVRGDLVVHDFPQDRTKTFVKRVVGVEGDRIELRDKALYVNGQLVPEPFVVHTDPDVRPGAYDPRDNFGPMVVPRGSMFVMGDNRDNSNDSRFFGPLLTSLVRGTVRSIYWSWDGVRGQPRWDRIGPLK